MVSLHSALWCIALCTFLKCAAPVSVLLAQEPKQINVSGTPPRVERARRFLESRGWPTKPESTSPLPRSAPRLEYQASSSLASTAVWQPLGPSAIQTPNFGLVTGRVSSIAIDPADVTGNHVYVGTTGGGVWASQNAASSSSIVFTPLTDSTSAFNNLRMASISIGAITVQPGGTGVILAGTGDPNDALDSYYGAGILRSTDGGNTWSAVTETSDRIYSFLGEGFAGFAWSTVNTQLVVAAVSEAYEGTLVDAPSSTVSNAGLYYSTDGGANWSLATITDGAGSDVEGPLDSFASPNGNSVTAVVWNPVRQLFVAAVRFHGYYQSSDGTKWTRMTAQPGAGLTQRMCPTNPGLTGSIACPIFRGALAVNPVTGDTFAWTVDFFNQDQGLWQDACAVSNGRCNSQSVVFGQRWSTVALESDSSLGAATIANGDYNLTIAAVPSAQDTLLFAGANDLWKCSLATGCNWRNTTNAMTCMAAQVAPYQHALGWNSSNPQEILLGNDSGLWRSMDAINESGAVCSESDASHFQNLNPGLGSLSEVESMSQVGSSPYTLMAGLGVNGTGGTKSTSGPTALWPQVLGGEGGPVAIDPVTPTNWYVNNAAGVSIYRCSQSADCTPSAFGNSPVVNDSDVGGDAYSMTAPAPFIVDPLDSNQLLVGTCRLWRGPADGTAWTNANAISLILDGVSGLSYCNGNALIRSIAALPIADGAEVIYVGMSGALDGGGILGGHVLKATFVPGSASTPTWEDIALNPVSNDQVPFNYYALDVSSILVDPHDSTGNTVYVTVAGVPNSARSIRTLYRTTDGGAHWYEITSNLARVPANSIVIDPQDAGTAYVATDKGVYVTRQVSTCWYAPNNCWSALGAGLPTAPVVQLSASPPATLPDVLVAGTYGRGIWQIPLLTAGSQLTTASVQPDSLSFAPQTVGTASEAKTVTVTNTGGIALLVTSITEDPGFGETDNCTNASVNVGATCKINVTFTPDQTGTVTGQITINANVAGGAIVITLSGSGTAAGLVSASPGSLDFGSVQIASTSTSLPVTLENAGSVPIAISSVNITSQFNLVANGCGGTLGANSACALAVTFAPTHAGAAVGTLTINDDAGTQTVALAGTGATGPTDEFSPSTITFSPTIVGQLSSPQIVTLSNNGDLPLNSISANASIGFEVSSNCGGSLGAHSSCAISVVFAPAAAGSLTGSLVLSDVIRSQTLSLSGTGLQPPALNVSPASLVFAARTVGTASAPQSLTISNTGGAPMANIGFQITGQSVTSYSWSASTCGATLAVGGSCSVQVSFTPATPGQLTATLAVSSSTAGVVPVQVPLSGAGLSSSGISILPSQMSFTQPNLGQPSAAQTATISNVSSGSANELSVMVSPPFSLTASSCGSTLQSGTSCTASIVFTPTANGVATGALAVSAAGFGRGATTVLVGTGGAAGSIQMLPASMLFGATGVGAKSAPQTVKLTNNSSVSIAALNLSISDGFEVASTACGASLDPGASCNVQIAFAPSVAGEQTGSLAIASPSLATNSVVSLSGMGFDFTFSTSGQASQTIASGLTASYNLTLAPLRGSSGTFSFSCGSLPANSSCSFNPTNELVAANSTGSVTLQIATGTSLSSAGKSGPKVSALHLLPLTCTLIVLPVFLSRRSKVALVVILSVCLIAITSCAGAGGGSGGAPPSGSGKTTTPAGTYSVVVTATANSVSHKTTLTLVVD